jgi:hypothetical protein
MAGNFARKCERRVKLLQAFSDLLFCRATMVLPLVCATIHA